MYYSIVGCIGCGGGRGADGPLSTIRLVEWFQGRDNGVDMAHVIRNGVGVSRSWLWVLVPGQRSTGGAGWVGGIKTGRIEIPHRERSLTRFSSVHVGAIEGGIIVGLALLLQYMRI